MSGLHKADPLNFTKPVQKLLLPKDIRREGWELGKPVGQNTAYFMVTGIPATIHTTVFALAATFWFTSPAISRKVLANLFSGTIPAPTSLGTRITEHGTSWIAFVSASA